MSSAHKPHTMLTSISKLLIIGAAHVLCGLVLYRRRIAHPSSLMASDLIVFALPLGAAFALYCIAFWSTGYLSNRMGLRAAATTLTSAVESFVSFWLMLIFAFGRYGT